MHEVYVDAFYIGKYEVTQGQWQRIMGDNPSYYKAGDKYPVETVSWNDAQDYIAELNTKGSQNFRLPTEAEWEYAARSGGTREKYAGGNDVDAVAWYIGNSGGKTHPVGRKTPNGLGLYDTSVNVWKWCWDLYDKECYKDSPRRNPKGPSLGVARVFRGGSWGNDPKHLRAADRPCIESVNRHANLGFRLVLPVQQ